MKILENYVYKFLYFWHFQDDGLRIRLPRGNVLSKSNYPNDYKRIIIRPLIKATQMCIPSIFSKKDIRDIFSGILRSCMLRKWTYLILVVTNESIIDKT